MRWARWVTEQHLIRHHALPNAKWECEVWEEQSNPNSWLESEDSRLGGRLPQNVSHSHSHSLVCHTVKRSGRDERPDTWTGT